MLVTLLALAPILLVVAIAMLLLWHRAHRARLKAPLYENAICHLGITIGIPHPRHLDVIVAALDSRYPLYEVVVVVDFDTTPLREITQRYHLLRVNAEQLLEGSGARALYRSHHRAHQQVVVVDMPKRPQRETRELLLRVAAHPYIMMLSPDSLLYAESVTYVANLIASYPLDETLHLRTIVGARVEVWHICPTGKERLVIISHILAHRRSRLIPLLAALIALVAPLIPIFISVVTGARLALVPAVVIIATELIGLYLSWRVVVKTDLFHTFGTITLNFYRFLVEDMRNFCYLYTKCEREAPPSDLSSPIFAQKEIHYNYDRGDKRLSTATRHQRRPTSGCRDYEGL